MAEIGLFYGTQTGYTQTAAETIQKEFGGEDVVNLLSRVKPLCLVPGDVSAGNDELCP